ncbi:unnamed protein product, partial [Sphacelaria rigidula]
VFLSRVEGNNQYPVSSRKPLAHEKKKRNSGSPFLSCHHLLFILLTKFERPTLKIEVSLGLQITNSRLGWTSSQNLYETPKYIQRMSSGLAAAPPRSVDGLRRRQNLHM